MKYSNLNIALLLFSCQLVQKKDGTVVQVAKTKEAILNFHKQIPNFTQISKCEFTFEAKRELKKLLRKKIKTYIFQKCK